MKARQSASPPITPPPLRRGASDQAAATIEVLRSWVVEDPVHDRETWPLLEQSFRGEPFSLSSTDDHADRAG